MVGGERGTSMTGMDRRSFLRGGVVLGGGIAVAALASPASAAPGVPAFVRSGRPRLTDGVQAGDVGLDGAVVWARADRPARMVVEVARDASFRNARRLRGDVLTPASDLTGKYSLCGLPSGADIHYRVLLEDLHDPTLTSEPVAGRFRTPGPGAQQVRFTWSGDCAGQG